MCTRISFDRQHQIGYFFISYVCYCQDKVYIEKNLRKAEKKIVVLRSPGQLVSNIKGHVTVSNMNFTGLLIF